MTHDTPADVLAEQEVEIDAMLFRLRRMRCRFLATRSDTVRHGFADYGESLLAALNAVMRARSLLDTMRVTRYVPFSEAPTMRWPKIVKVTALLQETPR